MHSKRRRCKVSSAKLDQNAQFGSLCCFNLYSSQPSIMAKLFILIKARSYSGSLNVGTRAGGTTSLTVIYYFQASYWLTGFVVFAARLTTLWLMPTLLGICWKDTAKLISDKKSSSSLISSKCALHFKLWFS